ncbi:hypothetical protein [Streptomyces sp. HSG2]|uniref:hypothetical protein n=1 Tax=Streptomyces sp. HSG2 TaxID=2797167 RepID=UPI00190524EE|nr:hypothetical protein [Streptomyces sp. HSG2]
MATTGNDSIARRLSAEATTALTEDARGRFGVDAPPVAIAASVAICLTLIAVVGIGGAAVTHEIG